LLVQQTPSFYGTRIFAQQQTDLIFCFLDLALRVEYRLSGAVNELFSLPYVQHRRSAVRFPALDQTQGFLASGQRVFGNFELPVECKEIEICRGYVGDQGRHYRFPVPIQR
jgi:hypothetical protein